MFFDCGQMVHWPPAPMQLAQVVEIRRTCVRIYYRCCTGRERQPIVNAGKLHEKQGAQVDPPLPFHNPMRRALMPRRKRLETRNSKREGRKNEPCKSSKV